MNVRLLLSLTVVACLLSGCRRDPSIYIEMLNAEKRTLEDELYELEYDYELLLEELEACRHGLPDGTDTLRTPTPAGGRRTSPPGVPDDIPALTPPTIESGVPADMGAASDTELLPIESGIGVPTLAAEPSSEEELPLPAATPADRDGADQDASNPRVEIDPLTRGADFDGRPGDDGLVVVVRPRGMDTAEATNPKSIAVVLLDPTVEGDVARVARWDITSEQIARYRQGIEGAVTYRLKLPWPKDPPTHQRLHLFVRYVTQDGQPLEADREIDVLVAGATVGRWTPRLSTAASAVDIARRPAPGVQETAKELEALRTNSHPISSREPGRQAASATPPDARSATRPAPLRAEQDDRPRWTPYR